jgi:cardiolipin synthase
MVTAMWFWSHHLVAVVVFALAVLFAARVLRERRSPASTFAWLLTIGLIPEVGVPLYLLFGGRKIRRRASQKQGVMAESSPLAGNRTLVLADGEAAFASMLGMLEAARRSVHLATFILADDEVGRAVVDLLTRKAAEGIEVRVLVDDLFSWRAGRRRLGRLRRAGGKVAFFMPMLRLPLRGRRPDLRNHRKILVVDGEAAIVGGMNIAREYMGPCKLAGRWRDVGIRIDGPAAVALDDVFRSDWSFAAKELIAPPPSPAKRLTEGEDITDAADAAEADDAEAADAADAVVRVVLSGPDVHEDHFYDAMLTGFFAAKRRIWIATPYFVPDEALTHALALAARRGVDVRVVVPARSNHWSADLAGAGYLRQVEEAGGRVFRYTPAMMHGKVIVIDEIGTLGSANMDIRSLFLNYEVALFFTSPAEVEALAGWIGSLLPECTSGMPAAGPVRALAEDLGRLLSPLI